ncbi:hypothetical protein GCM10009790_20570 [Georgenia ruanii]
MRDLALDQAVLLEPAEVEPDRVRVQAEPSGQLVHAETFRRVTQRAQDADTARDRAGEVWVHLPGSSHSSIVSSTTGQSPVGAKAHHVRFTRSGQQP